MYSTISLIANLFSELLADSRSGTPQNVLRKSPSSEVGGSVQRDNQAANKDKGPRNNQNQIKNNQQRDKRDSPRHVDQENKGGYKVSYH